MTNRGLLLNQIGTDLSKNGVEKKAGETLNVKFTKIITIQVNANFFVTSSYFSREAQKRNHNLKGRDMKAGIPHFNLDRLASNTMVSHRLIQLIGKKYGLRVR